MAPFLRRNPWALYQKISDEPINHFNDGDDGTSWGNRSHWLRRLPFLSSGREDPQTIPCGGKGTRDGRCNHQGGHEEGGKKDANVLLLRIPEYDEALEFYIVKKNFRVDVDLETAFKSEERMVMPVTIPPPVDDARASLENIVPNVFQGGRAGLADEIEQLRAEGIEVDDDNEPLPEEATIPPPDPEGTQYNWEKPTFCPRRVHSMPKQ